MAESRAGFFTSWILIKTSQFTIACKSFFSFSISEPLLPIIIPGFLAYMFTTTLLLDL